MRVPRRFIVNDPRDPSRQASKTRKLSCVVIFFISFVFVLLLLLVYFAATFAPSAQRSESAVQLDQLSHGQAQQPSSTDAQATVAAESQTPDTSIAVRLLHESPVHL